MSEGDADGHWGCGSSGTCWERWNTSGRAATWTRDRIGVYGVSMGAATALLTIKEGLGVRALVTDSAFATLKGAIDHGFRRIANLPPSVFRTPTVWFASRFAGVGLNEVLGVVQPLARIKQIAPCPILIIHGTEDDVVFVQDAYQLYLAAEGPKEIFDCTGTPATAAHIKCLATHMSSASPPFSLTFSIAPIDVS